MRNPAIAALAFATLSIGGASAQAPIGGRYNVAGTNLDGTSYIGQADIQVTSETTCRIRWRTGGGSAQDGICMRQGAVFTAAYVFSNGRAGLVIYRQQDDGSLVGSWTIAGTNGVGREVLSPAR
jgi:hypothetical protein